LALARDCEPEVTLLDGSAVGAGLVPAEEVTAPLVTVTVTTPAPVSATVVTDAPFPAPQPTSMTLAATESARTVPRQMGGPTKVDISTPTGW
jgi:hypothetical protein